MAIITVSAQDIQFADTFLTTYLQDKITDADFSEGSVLRDFVVKAIAHIFAFLERERKITRDRQSLLSLAALPSGESIDDAVDALLSNWFLTRRTGALGSVTAVLHFSQAIDVELAPTTRFFRTKSLVFLPAITDTLLIPASELRPNANANGEISDFTAIVTLAAAKSGTVGNVDPGRFVSADPFNSAFLFAENVTKGNGGKDIETTTELLARAPTAISVRNLVNVRSIDTVLRESFPVEAVRVIGYGDPEMVRDFSAESVSGLQMHLGGHVDIYVKLPRVEIVETLTVGGLFARPDGLINILRDTQPGTLTGGSFLSNTLPGPVRAGQVLHINAGLPNAPREYLIVGVTADTLEIQPRAAFPAATDEASPAPTAVDYTVGNLAPSFDNVVGQGVPRITGQTSRSVRTPGHVTLLGRPQYKITSVEVITGASSNPLVTRVNRAPLAGQFQVITRIPGNAQSALAVTDIVVPIAHEGLPLRVRYETLLNYADIQNHVQDRFERVIVSNPLVKGLHPIYLNMSMQFKLKAGAIDIVDPAAVKTAIADYINAFDPAETLELSGILRMVRDTFPNIGAILSPVVLNYDLLAPDGQVYSYTTGDLVSILPTGLINSARLTNGSTFRAPLNNADIFPIDDNSRPLVDAANVELLEQLTNLGVSDRTVTYYANASDITVTEST